MPKKIESEGYDFDAAIVEFLEDLLIARLATEHILNRKFHTFAGIRWLPSFPVQALLDIQNGTRSHLYLRTNRFFSGTAA